MISLELKLRRRVPRLPHWTRAFGLRSILQGQSIPVAKNLDTGATYSFNGDERVRTASTIKVAVMIEAFARVAEGRAKWTDELVLTKPPLGAGSGVLPELADGLRLTLRDCVNL